MEQQHFGPQHIFDTSVETTFKLAIQVENYLTNEILNDPSKVKWFAQYMHQTDGVLKTSEIPMHVCTDKDYESFFDLSPSSRSLESIKEKGGMMCIDWEENPVLLFHNESQPSFRSLDIMLLPCGQPETNIGGAVDRIPDDCEFDRNKLIEYLGPLQMLIYHNYGDFNINEYGN